MSRSVRSWFGSTVTILRGKLAQIWIERADRAWRERNTRFDKRARGHIVNFADRNA